MVNKNPAPAALLAAVAAVAKDTDPMLDVDQLNTLAKVQRAGLVEVKRHLPPHMLDTLATGLQQLEDGIAGLEALVLEFLAPLDAAATSTD